MYERGVILIVTEKYIDLAKLTIDLLRLHVNDHILLISNIDCLQNYQCDNFHFKRIDSDFPDMEFSRFIKTNLIEYTIFEKSMFLDVDIAVQKNICDLWNYLNHNDFAIAFDPSNPLFRSTTSKQKELNFTIEKCGESANHYNTGVFLFNKCDAVNKLFKLWHQEWNVFNNVDQMALIRAIALFPEFKIAVFSNYFNEIPRTKPFDLQDMNGAAIIHFAGILYSLEEVKKIISKLKVKYL